MDAASFHALRRLIALGRHSLLQYVTDACPWTTDKTRAEFAHVVTLAREERDAVGRLIRYLQKKHMPPRILGSYPGQFTMMNFVTMDFLLPKLIEEDQKQVAEIETCLASAHDEEPRALIAQYLEMKRRHLQTLQQAR